MHIEAILDNIEVAVENQLSVGEGGDVIEEAAVALMAALRPAIQQGAFKLAEQAAAEVAAQLQGYSVSVVLEDGEPSLLVREEGGRSGFSTDELSARITLRLPDRLKDDLESAAGAAGDSMNAYVVKALSSRGGRRAARRITDTFET